MSSIRAPSSETVPLNHIALWNPEEVLGVRPRACNGITKRGAPCELIISSVDKKIAYDLIEELSKHDPRLGVPTETLEDLAHFSLCKRWHRKPGYSQVNNVAAKWKGAINEHVTHMRSTLQDRNATRHRQSNTIDAYGPRSTTVQPRRPTTPIRAAAGGASSISRSQSTSAFDRLPQSSSGHHGPTPVPVVPHVPSSRSVARSTHTTGTSAPGSTLASPRAAVRRSGTPVLRANGTTPATPPTTVSSTAANSPTRPFPDVISTAANAQDSAGSDQASETDSNNPATNSEGDRGHITGTAPILNSTTPQLASPTPSATPSSSTAVRPAIHNPRRRALEDCSICMESLLDSTRVIHIVHCRAQCGQNFHLECMDKWSEQQQSAVATERPDLSTAAQERRRRKAVTCPYCRSRWKWDGNCL